MQYALRFKGPGGSGAVITNDTQDVTLVVEEHLRTMRYGDKIVIEVLDGGLTFHPQRESVFGNG